MKALSLPKLFFIVVGIIAMLLGILTGVLQIVAMFSQAGMATYNTLYPNTLSGAAQESAILFTNFWLAFAGIMGGLLFIAPVKMGRVVHAAGYTTPDEEVVPKSYRAGGIYLIIGGILALIARLAFAPTAGNSKVIVLILPLIFIVLGVTGLVAGMVKAK